MRRWTLAAGAVSVGWAAACGGIFKEVTAETFSELTVRLEQAVPETDAHYTDAADLLDDGWVAAWEGHAGFGDVISFQVVFEDTLLDGALSDGEMVRLREASATFLAEPVSAERRAELLLIKRDMDDKHRSLPPAIPPPPPGAAASAGVMASWELPGGVRAALEGAGWTVVTCSDTIEAGEHWVGCMASKDGHTANVDVLRFADPHDAEAFPVAFGATRQDGTTVLEVVVHDGAASDALMDVIVPKGTHLGDLDPDQARKALGGAGFTVEHCDDHMEGRIRLVDCEASQGDRQAIVTLELQKGGRGRAQRQLEDGIAMIFQGHSTATALVMDGSLATELAERLAP